MFESSTLSPDIRLALRNNGQARLEVLRSYRISWWLHWADLAAGFCPRRYRWFVTPNTLNRGSPRNQAIIDETGMLAARTLATGLLSGLTSPTKPWFMLGIHGVDSLPEGPEKQWLADTTRILLQILGGTNFYQVLGQAYSDLVIFGSAPILCYEDDKNVCHFFGPCMGEFMFALNNKNEVDTLYREYTYTVGQTIKEFKKVNCSPAVRRMSENASSTDQELVICHAIEPNEPIFYAGKALGYPVPKRFAYREVYWEQTSPGGATGPTSSGHVLRVAGFAEQPFAGMRWDVTTNDAYGRSPGMDGLPANRQLQVQHLRLGEAIDKQVRPPMVGSSDMKNEPVDTMPGGVTYVAHPEAASFKPAYSVNPNIEGLNANIAATQDREKRVFFTDLFLMISDLQTVRSATEIDARNQEKIIQLGPVIERVENEGLATLIVRVYAIAKRKGLIPPAPMSLHGAPLSIRYISMLSETQRAAATSAMERLVQFTGGMVAVKPDVFDNINADRMVNRYADLLNDDPSDINPPNVVALIRQQRQAEMQQQASLQVGQAAAQGAQTLSQTDVGGGKNALQLMLGEQQQQAA